MPEIPTGTVKLVSTPDEFAALRNPWNAVAEAAGEPAASIFARHEWFDAAWHWRRETADLYLLCFYAQQQLTAVLPLVRTQLPAGRLRRRELAFLTVPDTQACDMIAVEHHRAAAAEAFVAELAKHQHEWDVIRLDYLSPRSAAASVLRRVFDRRGFTTRLLAAPGNPFISLESTWDAYYATRTRRLKKANNLAANRLDNAGDARIEWLAPDARHGTDPGTFVGRAISISASSWKTRTGNSLDNAGPHAFIRRLSELASQRGWLSIWILALNGRAIAMEYQLVADGNVHALRSDFDAEFEDISPGSYLNRCITERLFGRGLRRYYMGPGNNAYKHRWAEQTEPVDKLSVYGRSLAGRVLAAWEVTLKPGAINLRNRLRGATSDKPDHRPD